MIAPREFDERIAELTRAGMTAPTIAETLGCSLRTVTRARLRTGLAQSGGRRVTPEESIIIEAMLADGASVIEIERTLGRSRGSLARRLRGRGWSPQESGALGGHCSRMARMARS